MPSPKCMTNPKGQLPDEDPWNWSQTLQVAIQVPVIGLFISSDIYNYCMTENIHHHIKGIQTQVSYSKFALVSNFVDL